MMIKYIEVKSSERLPTILPRRRKFVIYRYNDGSSEMGLEVADAEEPYQYWLERVEK